jgi:hypothetical protein
MGNVWIIMTTPIVHTRRIHLKVNRVGGYGIAAASSTKGGGAVVITSNKDAAIKHQIRAAVRHQVSINAILYCHGFPLAQCTTRDIGPDGMFIKTGPLRVSKNTVLALEFELSIGSATQHYRLPVFLGVVPRISRKKAFK